MDITLISQASLSSDRTDEVLKKYYAAVGQVRFVCDIEKLVIATVAMLLDKAGIKYPVGDGSIALYIGVDDCMEVIKKDYFTGVLQEGLLGASPLLFPYTSANVLAAKAAIVFDLRGENLTFNVQNLSSSVIEYLVDFFKMNHSTMAITGIVRFSSAEISETGSEYSAEFFLWHKRDEK